MVKSKLRQWPADRVQRWKISRIREYERNARLHSDEQIEQIAESMQKFGVTSPVLVDEKGVLIYGHGRFRAAKKLGYTELPVAIARGWSENEKRGYRVLDNQLALNSTWDEELLIGEIDLLRNGDDGFDMGLLGFSDAQLSRLQDLIDHPDATAPENLEHIYQILIECSDESDQLAIIEKLQQGGLKCRALIS